MTALHHADVLRALDAVRTGDPDQLQGALIEWQDHAEVLAAELEAANRRTDEVTAALDRVIAIIPPAGPGSDTEALRIAIVGRSKSHSIALLAGAIRTALYPQPDQETTR